MSEFPESQLHERRAPDTGWHLKREVQLGQIASILVFGLTGVFYVTTMDKRITVIETQLTVQKERDAQQDKAYGDALAQIHSQMDRIDAKLDRIVERGMPK